MGRNQETENPLSSEHLSSVFSTAHHYSPGLDGKWWPSGDLETLVLWVGLCRRQKRCDKDVCEDMSMEVCWVLLKKQAFQGCHQCLSGLEILLNFVSKHIKLRIDTCILNLVGEVNSLKRLTNTVPLYF